MENKIYILSDTIRSGKTTALFEFCNKTLKVGGIFTPDINGVRKIYYPSQNKCFDFQIESELQGINVGRFNFSNEAFNYARNHLKEVNFDDFDWVIIDEIGKLELLSANGFEPELSALINRFKVHQGTTKLILVIRDSLLQLAMEFYEIKNAKVIGIKDLPTLQNQNALLGVILCGGQSSRMGFEKMLANYHGVPQYQFLNALLKKLNIDPVISIRNDQVSLIDGVSNIVLDSESYNDAGPLTGLLSVHEKYPEKSVLLVGCDYPLLNEYHILLLVEQIQNDYSVICYQNNVGIDEPLVAYYSNQALKELKVFHSNGGKSLKEYIKSTNVKRLSLEDNLFLTSVDTPTEHEFILNQIKSN
jgi:molybdopterin-guanine dinucleotide biosynthesis protein A/nucleoside-triphosphatase THEP1